MLLPLIPIRGSVIFPRSYLKIVFVTDSYKEVAKHLNQLPEKQRLFATIQKNQLESFETGGKILGTICKLLDYKTHENVSTGIVLGITPAIFALSKKEGSIFLTDYEVIHEENHISDEEGAMFKTKLLRTLETYVESVKMKFCTERDIALMELPELVAQISTYFPFEIDQKLKLLSITSLRERIVLLEQMLNSFEPKSVQTNCDHQCTNN